jgi:protein-L-isoaspartate(D-aspartate) O-methyltransferase
MSDMEIKTARFNMVEQQIRPWEVFDKRVLDLMGEAPRHEYVPPAYRNLAFADLHIPLANGREMMSPKVEARLLQALEIQPTDKILEVGTGCGYLTSLLAALGGQVISVDTDTGLSAQAAANLSDHGVDNVTLEIGDATKGWEAHQPYDVIVVNGSMPCLPQSLYENLTIGGRLAAIIGKSPVMEALLIQRVGQKSWSDVALFETDLAALPDTEEPQRFVF